MNLDEIVNKTFEKLKTFKPQVLLPALRAADNEVYGGTIWDDVMNINGCANYQFSTCLVDLLKPKQIVELGGAMGAWSLCVLHSLPPESKLYSITVRENGKEFMFVVDKYPNFYPIIGDDLELSNWDKFRGKGSVNNVLSKTDIWYFDALHSYDHVTKELNLYSPFFKKDALLLFDDIHLNDEMERVWAEIQDKWETKDLTDPLHYTGWGIAKI